MCRSTTPPSQLTPAMAARPQRRTAPTRTTRASGAPVRCAPSTPRWNTRSSPFRHFRPGSRNSKVGQEVYYPYNASSSPTSYFYYKPGANGGSCPSQTTVGGTNPTYHQWVSVLTYNATNATDPENANAFGGGARAADANKLGGYISNPPTATVDKYYRLRDQLSAVERLAHLPGNRRTVHAAELCHREWCERILRRAQGLRGATGQSGDIGLYELRHHLRDG